MSLPLFLLSSADRSHATHRRANRTGNSTVLSNEPPILADSCMCTSSLLLRRRRLYCAQEGHHPLARERILDPSGDVEVTAALPTAVAHALESWVLAPFRRLGSGLEVRENTEKQQGRGA